MIDSLKEFFTYLKSAPVVVQIFSVLFIVGGVFALIASGIIPIPGPRPNPNPTTQETKVISKAISQVGQYADGGSPAPPNANSGNAPANIDAMAQQQAAAWHGTHSDEENENPAWVDITRVDARTYVKYRFFRDADGCLEIKRSENGKFADKWVLDPLPPHPLHEAKNHAPLPPDSGIEEARSSALGISARELVKQVRSILPKSTIVYAGQNFPQMQVPSGPQYCLNPHPGQYTWYWGQVNGCQQPQFRNFSDGCQHYQIFNVCAGVWEPQIYWTYCRAH